MNKSIAGLNYINETKQLMKAVLVEKEVNVSDSDTFRSYVSKFQNADRWHPPKNSYDIDEIIAEDTEDYNGKLIMLLTNEKETTDFYSNLSCAKIKTSDGAEYDDFSSVINHTWDASKDKNDTRYVILYYSNNINIEGAYGNRLSNCIYMIYKGNGKNSCWHSNPDRWHSAFTNLKKIKFDNITVNFFDNFSVTRCIDIENCKFGWRSSFHSISATSLRNLTISNITNSFTLNTATNLSHESLLNVLNALKDYSESTAVYTLSIGFLNIKKLSDEELAIATDKGWTII